MGITVAGAINTATTAVVRPRVSYEVLHPTTTVITSVPVTAVAYVDIVLGAALDTTGRYKFVADVSAVVDSAAFTFERPLDAAFTFTDTHAVAFAKGVSDSVVSLDALTTAVAKVLADDYGLTDAVAHTLAKASFDAVGVPDNDTFSLAKLVQDGVGMNDLFDTTDGSLYSFVKHVANVVFANEQLTRDVSKKLTDSVVALSRPFLSVDKAPFVDATGETTDFSFRDTLLGKADSVGVTSATSFDITKPLTDAFSYAEFFASVVDKSLTDTTTATDAVALGVDKPTHEVIYTTEHAVYDLGKALSDSVAFSDVVYAVRLFERTFEDALSAPDYQIWAVSKGLADAVTTPEAVVFTHNKLLTDGFALNDLADIGDGITFLLVQNIANVALISDNSTRQLAKSRTETLSVTDSGSLVNQDYCDLTYFAEDYVGSSRSF